MICKKCNKEFNIRVKIDGKERNLQSRKYCLDCSPFGQHNTRKLDVSEKDRRSRDKSAQAVNSYRKRNAIRAKEFLGNKCFICGYNKCVQALDFHHINPKDKSFQLASNFNKKWETIFGELKKCVLLCSNCHREVEAGITKLNL